MILKRTGTVSVVVDFHDRQHQCFVWSLFNTEMTLRVDEFASMPIFAALHYGQQVLSKAPVESVSLANIKVEMIRLPPMLVWDTYVCHSQW